jgi:hypothetical protein
LALIDDVKSALRITNTAFNTEISDLILAAKADLGISGVLSESISDSDALIKRAIILYCKANFGWENSDSEKLQQSYDMLKNHLSLSSDYSFFEVTFTVKNSSDIAIRNAEVTFNEETKTTNASGVAIFYVRAGNNYTYSVIAEDYYVDDDENNLVDVSASTSVAITLTGV